MIDFLFIARRTGKHGVIEIYPKLIIKHSKDLMIRGGDFYAIWLEERGLWSTDEQDALQLIDRELDNYAEEHKCDFELPGASHVGCRVRNDRSLAQILSASDAGLFYHARREIDILQH